MPEQQSRGFPDVLGAALGGGVGEWISAGEAWTAVLVLVGIAVGSSISGWWRWAATKGELWREADLAAYRRRLEMQTASEEAVALDGGRPAILRSRPSSDSTTPLLEQPL
jgi:hypothetical protein